jgi:multiple sugar transport system ATP-binding protein
MSVIDFRNITKMYGDQTVGVEDLSMTIEDQEFVVLVGPSGCGKTTTLEIIAGLQRPTSGEFSIDGTVMNEKKPQERGIAMVFQNYALYPHKTVRENIRFGLKYTSDLSKAEMDEKVIEVAELLGIEEFLDQKPKQLSGGQQQRVALGRAIVRDPSVFLLDEPLSNLDAKLRTTMRAELQRLQNDLGVTTVYVTHDQTEAMTMGDRIAVMNDGRLQQIGTPIEVFNEPANEFVANFIGSPSINFLPGELTASAVSTDVCQLPIDQEQLTREYTGTVTLGIRPEDIEVTDDTAAEPRIDATVTVVEKLGTQNVLYLDARGNELITVADEGILPEVGDSLSLTFKREQMYLFDAEGETLKTRVRNVSQGGGTRTQ